MLGCAQLARAQSAVSPAPAQTEGEHGTAFLGTILLVRMDGDERVVANVRAELRASAWRIVEIGPDPRLEQARLAELGASQGASSALRVHADRAEVELWVARSAGPGSGLELLDAAGAGGDERVLALRVAEALRARGLRLEPAAEPVPPQPQSQPRPPAPPAEIEPPPPKPAPRVATLAAEPRAETLADDTSAPPAAPIVPPLLSLEIAPTVALGRRGLGPSFDGWLGVRLGLSTAVSIAAFGVVPIVSDKVSGNEGSARVSTFLLGGTADLAWALARFRIRIGAGAAWVFSLMSGHSNQAAYTGQNQAIRAVAPLGRMSLSFALGAGWSVYAGAMVGVAFPAISVHFDKREVGRFGRPLAVGSLGLELPLLLDEPSPVASAAPH